MRTAKLTAFSEITCFRETLQLFSNLDNIFGILELISNYFLFTYKQSEPFARDFVYQSHSAIAP